MAGGTTASSINCSAASSSTEHKDMALAREVHSCPGAPAARVDGPIKFDDVERGPAADRR
jgi:hypothetical protein